MTWGGKHPFLPGPLLPMMTPSLHPWVEMVTQGFMVIAEPASTLFLPQFPLLPLWYLHLFLIIFYVFHASEESWTREHWVRQVLITEFSSPLEAKNGS